MYEKSTEKANLKFREKSGSRMLMTPPIAPQTLTLPGAEEYLSV